MPLRHTRFILNNVAIASARIPDFDSALNGEFRRRWSKAAIYRNQSNCQPFTLLTFQSLESLSSANNRIMMSTLHMNIGTVAQRSGVPPKTIRYYEDIGLLAPPERMANGYRSYSPTEMHTLQFIKRARSLGFSVEEVRGLLDLWRDRSRRSKAVKAVAARHLQVLDQKMEELKAMRKVIADMMARCSGDERPECPIIDDLAR
jgi:MerR family transcriptional regulator, copper efflux regulator